MDILYIIGKSSKHDNIELRYSLRSICKYGHGIDKVVVAGTPPDWLSKEAVQVCVSDPFNYKHSNILRCIENVVNKGIVSGDFLYSSDDHFYVRPTDFNNYPYYYKSEHLRSVVDDMDKYYKYHRSLVDTRMILLKNNLPDRNYSQHCNTHMHSEIIKEYSEMIHSTFKLKYGVEPTSIIMNAWSVKEGFPKITLRHDSKIDFADDVKHLRELIGSREAFSIGDAIFNVSCLQDLFNEEFPDKCIFEM